MPSFPFALRLVLAVVIFATCELTAQPTLPRNRMPQVSGSIQGFVDRLYSAAPRERAEAACQIGRRHAEAAGAIPVLISMLSDDVTVAAIECEMSRWMRRTLPQSTDAQKWMETSPAKEAAGALGNIGNAAVPALLQALQNSDWKSRKFAAIGLGEVDRIIEPANVIAALASRLTDVHPEVRDRSAWALGEIEDATAVGPLLNALTDTDSRVRARAAWALGEIEHPSAVNGLLAALTDSDAVVRERSIGALGEIESDLAVEGLVPFLTDPDVRIRRQVVWALGEIEDAGAVDGLTRALNDDDWRVRKTVAWALGEIEDPTAIDALRSAASDSNSEVRRAVAQAIRELRGHRRDE
jgi:HEAT repeat protein